MAKTTTTHITDDIDGTKDAAEVAFSFGGSDYTIDLSKKNAAALEKALKPYLEAATKLSRRSSGTSRRSRSSSTSTRNDYSQIRDWARQQGLQVSDRGRVPAVVIEQYEAAN